MPKIEITISTGHRAFLDRKKRELTKCVDDASTVDDSSVIQGLLELWIALEADEDLSYKDDDPGNRV
jgi:hypothetical protein